MHRTFVCALAGAAALIAQSASAAVTVDSWTLSGLVGATSNGDGSTKYNPNDPSTYIQVGDKRFTNFGYSQTGDMPTPDQVNVIPTPSSRITTPNTFGITFQGGFQDLPNINRAASDALISYTVLIDPAFLPVWKINDAHIAANFLVIGPGSGTITETFVPDDNSALIKVYNLNNSAIQLSDDVVFPQTHTLIRVQKDILLDAGVIVATNGPEASGQIVQLSFVDQTFSQVPEPASLGVLGLGGLALLLRRRKA
jgi:hypothetical protein